MDFIWFLLKGILALFLTGVTLLLIMAVVLIAIAAVQVIKTTIKEDKKDEQ